ncbi:hypothetical protein [Anaerolentibacter hominis]|uniref:hypothetical protein n=1 Tax=Anaerolentibacter hominis TaxID=3079009 RepID=UPI0031B85F21
MKKMTAVIMILCCLLTGCAADPDNITGDVNTGDTDTGDEDTGSTDRGVYVKMEADFIYSVEWECTNRGGSVLAAGSGFDTDVFILLTTDIVETAEADDKDVEFKVTAKRKDGKEFAANEFTCKAGTKRMELAVTKDGSITEQDRGER